MTIKKLLLGTGVVLIGLPVLLILTAVVSIAILDRTDGAIVSSGKKREYLLHVPASYDPATPAPLVISLHGAMNWPAYQMKISQWNTAADENGFLVVYPAGTGAGPKAWFMDGEATPSAMPDVVFISALIDTLEEHYRIDPTRIYVNGLSNGGGMAFVLSCTLSRRIAAIGAVAAAQSLPWSWCPDSTPMPMIAFHGTADPIVPYGGAPPGWLNPRPFPDVVGWTDDWARRNQCATPPVDSAVTAHVTRREYRGCADDATVVLYTIRGGGHQWPGGDTIPTWLVGPMSDEIDATALMWAFFREHPLRRN
jgi:polyhydroxybutyrate depolymerase